MKKTIHILFILLICTICFNFNQMVNAEELLDVSATTDANGSFVEETYTYSENEEKNIPYVVFSGDKITCDTNVNHSGLDFADDEIRIMENSYLKGLHFLISQDTVNILGKVDYPIILAENVIIDGIINQDMLIFASSVFIKENANILGDVIIVSESLDFKGSIDGSLIFTGSSCNLEGTIGKDFRAMVVTSLSLNNETISGNVVIKSNADMANVTEKYPDAKIEKVMEDTATDTNEIYSKITSATVAIVLFTLVGFAFVIKDNSVAKKMANKLAKSPSSVFVTGSVTILASFLVAILFVLSLVTSTWLIAIPFTAVYAALLVVGCMLAVGITSMVIFEIIKKYIIKDEGTNKAIKYLGLLFGINVLVYCLTIMPYVGSYITLILDILSIGCILVCFFKGKTEKAEKIEN